MIKIIIDLWNHFKRLENHLVVNEINDYINSRIKIKEIFKKGDTISVVVKNNKFKNWYKSLIENEIAIINQITPKSLLADELKISANLIPYSNEDIHLLNLLSLIKKNPPMSIILTEEDFEKWVINNLIDGCWIENGGDYLHICRLTNYYLKSKKNKKEYPNSIQKYLENKQDLWKNTSMGNIYNWFFENPQKNSFLIYCLFILKNYKDSTRNDILNELFGEIDGITKSIYHNINLLDNVKCQINKKNQRFSEIIERKLKSFLIDAFEECKKTKDKNKLSKEFQNIIFELLSSTTGKMEGEIDALYTFIKNNLEHFNNKIFISIAGKFPKYLKKIEEIKEFISPPFPKKPLESWSWENMEKWLRDEYFPFRIWLIKNKKNNQRLDKYSLKFSIWLYNNYPLLKNELTPLNYGTLYRIKKYIKENKRILWVIIDNLSWISKKHLKTAFLDEKFEIHPPGEIAKLSMLPSETKISKYALLAGKLSSQISKNKHYKELFEDFCKNNKIQKYLFINDTSLKDELFEDRNIICCMLNELDFTLHKDHFDLEDRIHADLNRWVTYIKNFIKKGIQKHNISGDEIIIIVSTDHGSYRLPSYARGINIPKETKISGSHKRYISIEKDIKLNDDWFNLDKDKFSLNQNIGIIKGYNYIGNKTPTGLIHGGMTPEETFIPHLEFCLKMFEIKPIECLHIGDPIPLGKIKRKTTFNIINPNNWKIENIRIIFPLKDIDIKLDYLERNSEKKIEILIMLSKENTYIQKDFAILRGQYSYFCMGKDYNGELLLHIKIRKLMDRKGTAEEFFEFG